jgi:sRNA-binding carbon storage regulator CsrA
MTDKKGFLTLTEKYNRMFKVGEAEIFVEKYYGNADQFRVHIRAPREIKIERTDQVMETRSRDERRKVGGC